MLAHSCYFIIIQGKLDWEHDIECHPSWFYGGLIIVYIFANYYFLTA